MKDGKYYRSRGNNSMDILVIFSLAVKVFGALLEIFSQSFISRRWSVETYGTYSFFVSLSELVFYIFFAGIVKCNNFYIPQGNDIKNFKKKFYRVFVFPVIILGMAMSFCFRNHVWFLACVGGFVYLLAMDFSSSLMSYGKYKLALSGEYVFGRIFFLLLIVLLKVFGTGKIEFLYGAYIIQFAIMVIFYFLIFRKMKAGTPVKATLKMRDMIRKYAVFQLTEISHIVVMQASVIIQYMFGGAYQTALISIILIVRRLINFISGPTSKLYQPEFSKKYSVGDKKGLEIVYAQIIRLQLCFMMPVFAFLIAAPETLLKVFNKELVGYSFLVQITSVVFLYMIAFGPQSNFLSMTGKEKSDMLSSWLSAIAMYVLMYVFRKNVYFVVIGFCAQIIFGTTYRLIVHLKFMKKSPMPVRDYIKFAVIALIVIGVMNTVPYNLFLYIFLCLMHFVINFAVVLPKDERNRLLERFMKPKFFYRR